MSDVEVSICAVPNCTAPAVYATYLRDDVPYYGRFQEPDHRCPYLCHAHAVQNEAEASGGFRADGSAIRYPFTKGSTTGYTRYQTLDTGAFLRQDDLLNYPALS